MIASPRSETGLTPVGQGRLLDEVVGTFRDEDVARRTVEDHILPSQRREILEAHGDMPMAAADILSLDDVLGAVLGNLANIELGMSETEDVKLLARLHILRAWAHKLGERADYVEFLDRKVGEYDVRDLLLLAIAVDSGIYGEIVFADEGEQGDDDDDSVGDDDDDDDRQTIDDITDDAFETLGLAAEASRARLVELMEAGVLQNVDDDLIAEAAEANAAAHRAVATAPTLADAVASTADVIAREDDL